MKVLALVIVVILAGCAESDAPEGTATIVVSVNDRGKNFDETFALEDGRLAPGELNGPRVYGRAGDTEPEEGITYGEIYLVRPGEQPQQLTSDRNFDGAPQLLRDGRVAFLSCLFPEGGGNPACALDAIDPKTRNRETLVDELGIVFHGELSPDERRFLFSPLDESGAPAGLFVRDLKGGEERRLVDGYGGTWSPDGRRIAFLTDRDRSGRCLFHDCTGYAEELYVANADGSHEQRLTQNPEVDGAPEWSGDGEWLVLGRIPDEDADWDLYAVRADGECERQLTDTPRWETGAEWHGGDHGGLSC